MIMRDVEMHKVLFLQSAYAFRCAPSALLFCVPKLLMSSACSVSACGIHAGSPAGRLQQTRRFARCKSRNRSKSRTFDSQYCRDTVLSKPSCLAGTLDILAAVHPEWRSRSRSKNKKKRWR